MMQVECRKTVIYHLLKYSGATICNFMLDLESLYPLFTAEPSLSNVHQASLLERGICNSSKTNLIAMAEMLCKGQWPANGYGCEAQAITSRAVMNCDSEKSNSWWSIEFVYICNDGYNPRCEEQFREWMKNSTDTVLFIDFMHSLLLLQPLRSVSGLWMTLQFFNLVIYTILGCSGNREETLKIYIDLEKCFFSKWNRLKELSLKCQMVCKSHLNNF